MEERKVNLEKITSLCQKRGFVFPSSDIYGGISGVWDYGPLGVELKRNIKEMWWRDMVRQRDDVVGLDSAILMNSKVWEASGHISNFTDPLVECKSCNRRWRADQVTSTCPACGGELTPAKMFNLMFKTFIGPVEDEAGTIYLRPETAQGIFVNFDNIINTTRKRLPLGIAQIGKSFRNEITTGNFIFRSREFEQMEMEFFIPPGSDEQWLNYWLDQRFSWYVNLGIKKENLRLRRHGPDELSHYAKDCYDIEYLFPMGWAELEGIASRTDYDLKRHSEFSGKSLEYFDDETNEYYIPYVIEPSAGVDRSFLALLCDAYDEEIDENGEERVVLRLNPKLASYQAAVLPLSRKAPLAELARNVYGELKKDLMVTYDESQSIGRRYRRQDEIGTPFDITVDFQSLEDNMATIRDRDTMRQIRTPISKLKDVLDAKLSGEPFDVLPEGSTYWLGF